MYRSISKTLGAPIAIVLSLVPYAAGQFYKQSNLVSDVSGIAPVTDPLLINPWGMSLSATGPLWVSNAGSGKVTLYRVDGVTGAVTKLALEVSTPGAPSGQASNDSTAFTVTGGGSSGPASFIFAGLNGTISGWNANVPPPPPTSTQAMLAAAGPAGSVYTGLAIGSRGAGLFLYAANNGLGRIDVFDQNFAPAAIPGAFFDPGLPVGDKPFNLVNVAGSLFVSYSGSTGVVSVFDTDGNFVRRFASGGTLLNPWGMALAPADFGQFSNALLVGNFNSGSGASGPGNITAFDASTGAFLGLLNDTSGAPLAIDGLWTLSVGNGHSGGRSNSVYFSAGVSGQAHGLIGSLDACRGPALSGAAASPNVLWPPNHKLVPVTIDYTFDDNCDQAATCSLSAESSEGSTAGDWQPVDAHHVLLRAERAGNGNGRAYTVTITCGGQQGLFQSATTTVLVPHDMR